MVKTEIDNDKSNEEIAKITGDLLKEKVFVYTKDTDRTQFVMTVSGALQEEYKDRADVFLLVFERGITQKYADEVKMEIAALWKDVLRSERIKNPEPETYDPLNPRKARWIRTQIDASEKTLIALKDFIVQ